MKKLTYIVIIIATTGLFLPSVSKAQVVITVRPEWHEDAHWVRPAPPTPRHVWVEGEWRWNRHERHYVHVPGYWLAERPGWVWVPGHWAAAPGGEEWVPGHWSRRY